MDVIVSCVIRGWKTYFSVGIRIFSGPVVVLFAKGYELVNTDSYGDDCYSSDDGYGCNDCFCESAFGWDV